MVFRKDIMFFSSNSTVKLILAYLIFFPLPFLCFLFSIQYLNACNRLVRIPFFFYRLVTAQQPTVTGVASFWFTVGREKMGRYLRSFKIQKLNQPKFIS